MIIIIYDSLKSLHLCNLVRSNPSAILILFLACAFNSDVTCLENIKCHVSLM